MLKEIKKELLNQPEKLKEVLEHYNFHNVIIHQSYISFGRSVDSSKKSISWNGGFTFTTEEASYHFAQHDVAVEANEFDKCQVLINGLERLEPVKFNSEVKDLRELISIKKNKNSQDITDEKEILINIFSKR